MSSRPILEYEPGGRARECDAALLTIWAAGVASVVLWIFDGQLLYLLEKPGGFDGLVGVAGYRLPSGNCELEYWAVSASFLGTWMASTCALFGLPWAPRFPVSMSFVRIAALAMMESWVLVAASAIALQIAGLSDAWLDVEGRWPAIFSLSAAWIAMCGLLVCITAGLAQSLDIRRHVLIVRRASAMVIVAALALLLRAGLRHPQIKLESQGAYTAIFLGWCTFVWPLAGSRAGL